MRISTGQIWSNATSALMRAQHAKDTATVQLTSGKIASDIGGYGQEAESLVSHQSALARLEGYQEVAKIVSERLESQNTALERAGDGASDAKEAILKAIASQSLEGLTTQLESSYTAFVDGINYKHQGDYLFGGGNEAQSPLAASSLGELASLPTGSLFRNGAVKKASTIDQATTLQTGLLAGDIAKETVDVFKDIKTFIDSNQPMTGKMSETQRKTLQDLANRMGKAYSGIVDKTALNGNMQNVVENSLSSLKAQSTTLTNIISTKTDVDKAEAYTKLQQADTSVKIAAEIVSNLKSSSLLDLLR
ncbi:flagellin [Asticcacaulis sp.]|uniref:flagellin n=1 Tax=Asticcacaulis sp. TaxID=1872648 RepID=UPI0026036E50|nr:flagellin [Asticcacaulis sp.]